MKKLLFVILAAAVSLSAADYSGVYVGKGAEPSARYGGGVPHTVQMTLRQVGNALQGTVQLDKGPICNITSGSVSGNSINIVVGSNTFRATGQLAVDGNTLTGTMTSTSGMQVTVALVKK